MITKDQWRSHGKMLRSTLSATERAYEGRVLTEALTADPRWQRARTVLLYLSFGSEWDTTALIHSAWDSAKVVALPVCGAAHQMQPCRYTPDTPLTTTRGSLREIAPEAREALAIEAIDFCLVPGLLFDPYGTRLGYGAGYYDRLLPQLSDNCTILAAGFDCQLIGDMLPCEATDFRLSEVWTPRTQILTRPPFPKKHH